MKEPKKKRNSIKKVRQRLQQRRDKMEHNIDEINRRSGSNRALALRMYELDMVLDIIDGEPVSDKF